MPPKNAMQMSKQHLLSPGTIFPSRTIIRYLRVVNREQRSKTQNMSRNGIFKSKLEYSRAFLNETPICGTNSIRGTVLLQFSQNPSLKRLNPRHKLYLWDNLVLKNNSNNLRLDFSGFHKLSYSIVRL